MNTRLLFIEDDVVDRKAFERYVREERLPSECTVAASVAEATKCLQSASYDIIIADYLLGDGTAFDILKLNLDAPVIVATGVGSEQVAVEAMKAGAYDYLIKDHDRKYFKVLQVTVERALRQKKAEDRMKVQCDRDSEKAVVIGANGGMAGVLRLMNLAASSDSPVLITGETGVGKNIVAKAIHYQSASRGEPFISVNCMSLPENLIEAELFGHEKGAFTGATCGKKGVFELADRGTIFLDEIGEMPLHLQGKLLSLIEDRKVRRLGGETEKAVSARITASTNVDLEKAVGNSFRKDLYYRLNILRIHIPPLRDRLRDIPELCSSMLREMTGKKEVVLADGELDRLMRYDWPGNVRELKNILERAVILQRGCELRPSEYLAHAAHAEACAHAPDYHDGALTTLEELERAYIAHALRRFSGDRLKTATTLGISLSTLKRRIKDWGHG